jgi:hypothetical protein
MALIVSLDALRKTSETWEGKDEDRKIKRKRQGNSPRCTISVQIHYSQYVITSSSRGDIFLEHMEGKNMKDLTKKCKRETDPWG